MLFRVLWEISLNPTLAQIPWMCMNEKREQRCGCCVERILFCVSFSLFRSRTVIAQEPFPLLPKLPMNDFPPEAPNDLAAVAKLILGVL